MFDDDSMVADSGDDPFASYLNADQRGGSTVLNNKPSYTVAQAAAQIDRDNDSWTGTNGKAYTVTYAFRTVAPSSMPSGTAGFSAFTAAQQSQAILAMNSWADVANITFKLASQSTAQILFGDYSIGGPGGVAFTYFPPAGDVWVNSTYSYETTPVYLGYGRQTLTHELGHAIGLDHPGDYDASSGTPSYSASAVYYEDSRQYTVMSYWSESNTGADFQGNYAAAPLMDDIAAAQRYYGANMTTRTGDTTYGFHSNTGLDYYTATSASTPVIFCVWDAGGTDTFDFSGYANNQMIDLREGHFSNVGGLTGNVSIAIGVTIENAIGGSGNDVIQGNSGNNQLSGGAGDDTIVTNGGRDVVDGGTGFNTLVLAGNRAAYSVISAGGNTYLMGAAEGVQVSNIGVVTFGDGQAGWSTVAANVQSLDAVEYLDSNTDLISTYRANLTGAVQQFVSSGFSAGRAIASFDVLRYIDSNPDLIAAFGTNTAAAENHYLQNGYAEGRSTTSFDPLEYIASNPDLIKAFGTNITGAELHYITNGYKEGRSTTSFDAREYLASNVDLIKAFGDNLAAAETHYITSGYKEGRPLASFNAMEYLASNKDLIAAFGDNVVKAEDHYITNGYAEGRQVASFDPLKYIASYPDLIKAFGENTAAATQQYVDNGYKEGRTITFNPLLYAASSVDLAKAFGTNQVAATQHYIDHGYSEGRPTSGFDSVAYLLTYSDLGAAGMTPDQALIHWLTTGAKEGRIGDSLFGRDQTNHVLSATTSDTLGTATDHDWFQVSLAAGNTIYLTESSSTFDGTLQIFSGTGVLLGSSTSQTLTDTLNYKASATGTYYVTVAAADGHTGDYKLGYALTTGVTVSDTASDAPASTTAVTDSDVAALMSMPATTASTVTLDMTTTLDTGHAITDASVVDGLPAIPVQTMGGVTDHDMHHLFDLAHHHQLA